MAEKKVGVIGFCNIGCGVAEVLYQKGVAGLELVNVADIDLERERLVANLLSIVGLSLFLKAHTGGSDPVIVLHIKIKGSF